MSEETKYLTLTELGRMYGVSNQRVGKWLKGLSLRTKTGEPSVEAMLDGYVLEVPTRQEGITFWIWHREKTTHVLDMMGYPRVRREDEAVTASVRA